MKKLCILVCPMDWGLGHASRCIPVIRAFMAAGCRVVVAASGPGAGLIRREFQQALPAVRTGEGSGGPDSEDITGKLNCVGLCTDYQEPAMDGEEELVLIPFPGFRVRYSRNFLFMRLIFQVPSFLYHKFWEGRELKKIAERYRPDLVVSDNRYGLVHPSIPSVIITHQLSPVMPVLLEPFRVLVSLVIRRWVNRFNECWIPDRGDQGAAGMLTVGREKLPAAFYAGWLSRFSGAGGGVVPSIRGYYNCPEEVAGSQDGEVAENGNAVPGKKDVPDNPGPDPASKRVLFILSGPEPHRSDLEEIVIGSLGGYPFKVLLVRGVPGGLPERESRDNIEIVSFMDSVCLLKAINDSELIVCRSGYSSVMDLLVLGKEALLVPTPGQTEQEYLGRWLREKGWFRVVPQKDLKKEICSLIQEDFRKKSPANASDKIFNKIAATRSVSRGLTGRGGEARSVSLDMAEGCDDMLKKRVELIINKIDTVRSRIRR